MNTPTQPEAWTDAELTGIGEATELHLTSCRLDGMLRPYTTKWVVRAGDDLYVRSAGGPDRPWYRHALASAAGRIRAGGFDADVAFRQAAGGPHKEIDAAYHARYDHYGPGPVGAVTGHDAQEVTVRLVRRHS